MKKCTQCGSIVDGDDAYCSQCGFKNINADTEYNRETANIYANNTSAEEADIRKTQKVQPEVHREWDLLCVFGFVMHCVSYIIFVCSLSMEDGGWWGIFSFVITIIGFIISIINIIRLTPAVKRERQLTGIKPVIKRSRRLAMIVVVMDVLILLMIGALYLVWLIVMSIALSV